VQQLRLDFASERSGYGHLVIGEPNLRAVTLLQDDRQWPAAALCVQGPPACGRTTLAGIWCSEGGGQYLSAEAFGNLGLVEIEELARGRVAIDDADLGVDDHRLLHLLNQAGLHGGRVLLTAKALPSLWSAAQPDLVSRLKAMTVVSIDLPDADVAHRRFEAACHRAYLGLPEDVWGFLERRVPFDYAVLEGLAGEMCEAVSGTGRGLTVPVAKQVLGLVDAADWDEDDEDYG